MAEFKLVIGTKDGKSYQKDVKGAEADALHNLKIGDKVSGEGLGFPGYEFLITGGSDKCGFPMRKGVQFARKKILTLKGVGFAGKNRTGTKQAGLLKKRTVCGDRISKIMVQVNLKVIKEGPQKFGGDAPAEGAKEEKEE
ncbi:30S ribosomal protein S6e [Candidatus Woesearchaeota archaeon]|nr:30S ribosomal protein S6e [Candidatus Woesearchaeota archaeon]